MKRAVGLLALALLLSACNYHDDAALIARSRRTFGTLPKRAVAPNDIAARVELGRQLYFSKELSLNGKQSCNTCHPVDGGRAGADGKPTSDGALGFAGRRNSPTVLNADLHVAMFWDGRAATLEEQAAGPITNRGEMAMPDASAVATRLRSMRSIDPELFRAAFPEEADPFTVGHAARAIAAFERTFRTSDRFDEYQWGNTSALTRREKEGLSRFMALGCTSCHNGPAIGARNFQRIGIVNPYATSDRGRFEVTHDTADEFVFKVPSLRNVALTAPYFHDGSVKDLPTAVEKMGWHQLGTKITPQDRDSIVAFLKALSDPTRT